MVAGRTVLLLLLLTLIPFTTYFGDEIVTRATPGIPLLYKCVVDSITHLSVAVFCFIYIFSFQELQTEEVAAFSFLCGILASLIDTDHFLAARSFSLKAATTLAARPLFHCTTLFFIVSSTLLLFSIRRKSKELFLLAGAVTIAASTHHLRDGYRRGLWICPFQATSNYSYHTYICMLIILTIVLRGAASAMTPRIIRHKSYEKVILLV